jgi:nicotinamidase/pyrazinamidase
VTLLDAGAGTAPRMLVATPLCTRDALIVADVQRDFLPGGTLAIPGGDAVVPSLNEYIRRAISAGAHVFVTRDWHPEHHCSFRERGGPWPAHCVQGTPGAEFAAELLLPKGAVIVSKGSDLDRDAYSAFQGTKLETALRALGVDRVLVGGLATEYCVLETVRDARAKGYRVMVLDDAVWGVDRARSRTARDEMVVLGAVPMTLQDVAA